MHRGSVLAAAASGSSPGLGPFDACHFLSHPVSCYVFSCSVNKDKRPKKYTIENKTIEISSI